MENSTPFIRFSRMVYEYLDNLFQGIFIRYLHLCFPTIDSLNRQGELEHEQYFIY